MPTRIALEGLARDDTDIASSRVDSTGARTVSDDGQEPLSGADNAWRKMGRIENLTTITGVLMFEEPVAYGDFRDRLEERLLRFDRFGQRVGGRDRQFRRPYWEESPAFDVETHIQHVALPEPQDKAAFERFVGGLLSRPLDERRPLWECYLVEGVGDGNAAVFRINHSLADGFALLYVLLGLADDPGAIELPVGSIPSPPTADGETEATPPEPGSPTPEPGTSAGGSSGGGSDGSGESVGREGGRTGPVEMLGTAARAVGTAWEVLTRDDEPETSLRGELGTAKRAAWTDEMDLDRIKAIGDEYDATVNDVMLAATAGAFRRVLLDRGEDVSDLELRGSVPVNLEPLEERTESLGNYFGLVFVPLPVGVAGFDDRIRLINERMDEQTAGVEAFLVYLTFVVAGHLPDAVQQWILRQFEDQATAVVTNVPGPVESFEFAGTEVGDVMFWAPEANDVGISLSIFSYDGGIRVGVAADASLLPDANALSTAMDAEIEALADDGRGGDRSQ